MNSEDEDFNDIYGNDEEQTAQKQDVTANEASKSEGTEASKPEEKENAATTAASSSLDQLAALQALSSNLTTLANKGSSSEPVASKPATENENNNNDDNSVSVNNTDASSTSQSTPAVPAGNNLPWDQLRQTMSQFQPPVSQQSQPQTNVDTQKKVKADLSKDSCKMFIGGLNWETTEDTLRDYFNKYGNVVELKIMKDNNTGRSRGFGFLTFENASSVDEVVKTQHILDGKVIDPKRAIPREEQDKTGKIFVGGIGADVRPKEFEEFFAQYGTIIDAQLMLDKDTGRSRGFGFVTYDSPDAVDRVCQSKYIEFKGKQIEIKRAEPRNNQKSSNQSNNMNNMNNNMGMNMMYQNPMMGGFNPMYNQQAMTDYYQQMQQYYQQMQQQTGVDYSQMFQQQMQMMMPGMNPGAQGSDPSKMGQPAAGAPNSNSATPQDNNDVQTLGNEQSKNEDSHGLPKGPRGPSPGSNDYDRYNDNDDYQYRGGNTGRRLNHRIGSNKNNYRGGGRGNRRSHGYHPYTR